MLRVTFKTVLIVFVGAICACSDSSRLQIPISDVTYNQPDYKLGDSWTYNEHYPIKCLTWKVGSFENSKVVQLECENNVLHYSKTNSLNLVKAISHKGKVEYQADPYWPHLSFPLYVGKCWDINWNAKDPALDWSWSAYTEACVVSYEKIDVSAGAFDALRIEYTDHFRCCGNFTGYDKLTTWYSPVAKTIIKFESKRYPFWDRQLVSYNLVDGN